SPLQQHVLRRLVQNVSARGHLFSIVFLTPKDFHYKTLSIYNGLVNGSHKICPYCAAIAWAQ
ncbi:MAG: hypothetical protein AAAC47_22145, partial [Pararhizobium sp.]